MGQYLFTIAQDLTKMQIDSNVAEADIGRISVGQPVEFTVDAYPDITFKGKVSQVRNAPINVQNVVTYDVVVKVDNSDLRLKPGMTANMSVIVASRDNVLRIPNAALRFRMPEGRKPSPGRVGAAPGQKGRIIWALENNKPKRVRVVTGISDGAYTELASGDLREEQELIVESLAKPKGAVPHGPRMF